MAPVEGRGKADGFLLFQCGVEKQLLPPLRSVVRRRLPELLLLRICAGWSADQVAGDHPGLRLQPDPAHPVQPDRHGCIFNSMEPVC